MARTPAPGTRERILAAVVPLFYTHGVRAVGMARIVAAAGCGKNLLYSHFPAKNDLVTAYLSVVRADRDRAADRALATAADPRAALLALVTEVADRVREPAFRGCAMRNYLTEFPADDEAPGRAARDYLASSRARIDDLAGQLGAGPVLADRVWLLIEALYAVAGRDDAGHQAGVAVALAEDLIHAG